jgi:hypothetical protein
MTRSTRASSRKLPGRPGVCAPAGAAAARARRIPAAVRLEKPTAERLQTPLFRHKRGGDIWLMERFE